MKYVLVVKLLIIILMLSACGTHAGNSQPPPLHLISIEEFLPGNPMAQALAKAAARGDVAEMDRLVAQGADVNARGAHGATLPVWVLEHPNPVGFRHLMELGADPNIFWNSGRTLMDWAAILSNEIGADYLRMAIEIGGGDPNLETPDRFRSRPVESALHPNDLEAFAVLYNAGAEIDYWGPYGGTLVKSAAGMDHFRLAYFMLEQEVNYQQKNKLGFNLCNRLQSRFNRNSHFATDSTNHQYMWFWRCIDFLEKRGEVFDIPPSIVRPAKLDTTPVDIFTRIPEKVKPTRSAYMHEVILTYPTPIWANTQRTMKNLKVRQKVEDGLLSYEYVPKADSFDDWSEKMSVTAAYSLNTPLEGFAQVALDQQRASCPNGMDVQAVEKTSTHHLYSYKCIGKEVEEGLLYLGKYKDTLVSVLQEWQRAGQEGDATRRAKALEAAKAISMKEGFRVIPMERLPQ